MEPVYGEALRAGTTYDLGAHTVTEAEIVEFAEQWDPQSFHVDRDAAAAGAYGGLIASGIHTMAVFQRLCVLSVYRQWSVIAGRRLDSVEFLRPVRPGDRLEGAYTLTAVTPDAYGRTLVDGTGELSVAGRPVIRTSLEVLVRTAPSPDRSDRTE